ncbi:MAG: DASS family sodium-coupled anion symporter [Candidatus Brocadia sp.]|nr:DASS family sodium-coupled anion symporter [Candidatus Brocadia sp.]
MDEIDLSHAEEQTRLEVISKAEERFNRLRRRAGFYAAPLAFCIVLWLTRGRLTPDGNYLSAVLACVLVLWMTETLPLPVSAMLGACMCIVFGVADARKTFAPFADPIIFLFIGGFIVARAMTLHHLDRRFALAILSLRWVGGNRARILGAFGMVTAITSMWVSNSAATAMMMPIAMGILRALRGIHQPDRDPSGISLKLQNDPFSTGIMLMTAFSASVGGICTPIGTPPNLIGIGLINKLVGVEINFFQWMAIGIPLCIIMYGVLFVLLCLLHNKKTQKNTDMLQFTQYLQAEGESLGGWTRGQINTLIAFGVAVALWITPGLLAITLGSDHKCAKFASENFPEGMVALIAASILFLLPTDNKQGKFTITWREAVQIDWGTILLMGGGMSLGGLMFSTGVAEALGKSVTNLMGAQSLWGLTAISIALAIVMSEMTSNAASANMIIPIVITLAKSAGINPIPPALGACLGASYGFMLPVSTPPNAIVYGTGLVPISKMVRVGFFFDICGFVIIWLGMRLLCPLMGWK